MLNVQKIMIHQISSRIFLLSFWVDMLPKLLNITIKESIVVPFAVRPIVTVVDKRRSYTISVAIVIN